MSEDGGRDPGMRRRRMLPAVTDVVRELARTVSTDPAVLFRAARSVVGDELARVKQGFESAPLNVLVKRARRQLEEEGVASPAADAEEPPEPKSISIPASPLKADKPAAPAADGPFQGAGAPELGWESDLNIPQEDAPFRSAMFPLPRKARGAKEISPPEKTAVPEPAPPSVPTPPSPQSRLPVPERITAPEGLAVERSGPVKPPKHRIEDLPLFARSGPIERPTIGPPPPPPPAPAAAPPPSPAPRPAPAPPPAPAWAPSPTPSIPPPPAAESSPPADETPALRVKEPEPRWEPSRPEPDESVTSEMLPPAKAAGVETEPVEPEMREFAFKAAERSSPPKKSGKTGWIVAVAVVLAVAAGLFWAVRTFLSGGVVKQVEAPAPTPVPAPKKQAEAAPVPAPAAQDSSAVAAAPAKAAPVQKAAPQKAAPQKAAPQKAAAAPVPKGKAAPLVTPDWSGKPVYVVHFSSHRDRPSAEKEARRLAGSLGKSGRAVEVDLGPKGVWYRVVIGEFASADEARAYRADLEAKKTPGLGFVYEMRGR